MTFTFTGSLSFCGPTLSQLTAFIERSRGPDFEQEKLKNFATYSKLPKLNNFYVSGHSGSGLSVA